MPQARDNMAFWRRGSLLEQRGCLLQRDAAIWQYGEDVINWVANEAIMSTCNTKQMHTTQQSTRSRHGWLCAIRWHSHPSLISLNWHNGVVVRASAFAVGRPGHHFPSRVIPNDFTKWYSQLPCLTLSTNGIVWRTSQ